MPTLPLYDPAPAHANAWHRVTAPGGYEWWRFEADGDDGRLRLVASFFDGFVFDPEYRRRYARYLRRPTRRTPPLPAEYPCTTFALYERGLPARRFVTRHPPGSFGASGERPEVRAGPHSMRLAEDGAYRVRLADPAWPVAAELTFRPVFTVAPDDHVFLSRVQGGADHRRVLFTPLCEAHGTLRVAAEGGSAERAVDFHGRGYHDHHYGSGPIGNGLRRWLWGRLMLDDRALVFHAAEGIGRGVANRVHLFEADAAGVRDVPVRGAEIDWATGRIRINEVDLTDPEPLEVEPCYTRLAFRQGGAACEVYYPREHRWPVPRALARTAPGGAG